MTMSTTGTSGSLIYDGDGNRGGKSVNGVPTWYLVDDLNPTGYPQVVEELNAAGAVQRQYTYGLQRISQNQFMNGAWTPSFYGYDGGGNVRLLTNSAGTVTDEYEYDAFGNSFTKVGTTPNNYLYRGEQFDPDLGLYYLRARYYNPLTGRFLSRDPKAGNPYDSKTLHRYTYAGGDPANLIDPSGKGIAVERILLIAALVVYEVAPHIQELARTICAAIDWADLLLTEDALAKSMITGEPPEGPDERDIFFQLAEDYCATF